MIDPATSEAFARIERRAEEVRQAFEPGFVPADSDVRPRSGPRQMPDASPLAVAPPEGSFFILQTPRVRRYSRDGGFTFEKGTLRARDGAAVLGFTSMQPGRLVPLRASAVDVALGRVDDPKIDPDGTVSCTLSSVDATSGVRIVRRVALGRIALARFPAGSEVPSGASGSERVKPMIGMPRTGAMGGLRLHVRQLGDVDLESGLERLHEAYVALEALQAAHKAHHDTDKAATDLLK